MSQTPPPSEQTGAPLLPSRFRARIDAELHPVELWLFGSRAKGTARPDSDWDLLAVVHDDAPDDLLDPVGVWRRLRDLSAERVDVITVPRHEFEQARHWLGSLSQIATTEGVRVDVG